ncbi:MAG TPA: spherulation-specific family 4 protein [Ktedonobacteraceae bacterium]
MFSCPRCGTNNDVDSEFCGNCGEALHNSSSKEHATQIPTTITNAPLTLLPPPARRKRPRWQVITLLVILALLLGSAAFVAHTIIGSPKPALVQTATPTLSHVTATTLAVKPMQEKVAIPAYFDPGSPGWAQIISGAPTSNLAVINPNNGPGTGRDQNYADQVTLAAKAGVSIIGYVATSYAGTQDRTRTLLAAEQDVDKYYSWYPNIEGIFVDEVSTDCGSAYASYYKPLYDYIKHKGSLARVILDPGSDTAECYMSVGDIIVNFEDSYSKYVNWSPVPWVLQYPANRFWQVIIDTSGANMPQAVTLSRSRNAGWIYITDVVGGDPFAALPSYWSNELLLVSHA